MRKFLVLFLLFPSWFFGQTLDSLSVEKIMRDPQWIGTSPSNAFWSADSQNLYFNWNPEQADGDSLYSISLNNKTPQKASPKQASLARAKHRGAWNADRSQKVFVKDHSLYLFEVKKGELKTLLQTTEDLSNASFVEQGHAVVFQKGINLYKKDLETGGLKQLTDFKKGPQSSASKLTAQEKFLKKDALKNSQVLRARKAEREKANKNSYVADNQPKTIHIGDRNMDYLSRSPESDIVVYQLQSGAEAKQTEIPHYVTESGYTKSASGRPVVGEKQPEFETFIYNRKQDTVYAINTEDIPGIHDIPAFIKNYPDKMDSLKQDPPLRSVRMARPIWNEKGGQAVVVFRAFDNKDRWIMNLDTETGDLKLLDRQHDDAWIGGPGIGYLYQSGNVGWINNHTIYYQSEKTGYSHLYTLDLNTDKKVALTQGEYEVQKTSLSPDHKTFYLTTNKEDPGQTQFYHLAIKSGKQTRITQQEGGNQVSASPDGKHLAVLHSTSNHPAELYLQKNKANSKTQQLTDKAESEEFQSYSWRKPDQFFYKDRDGKKVHAEVYKPEQQADSKPGVIFVHGAGYLQDVKDSWSDPYFREHLFMNLLADRGYTVMNIDYRGSAGYGRDWRTAIYRHMGKNDLADIVDGAEYMTDNFDVNPENIGLWGGSYGGFMTLMAMFKTDVFAAGGALRSVTDWAHYNHGYTSNILNLPQNDSIAYEQSSPINFAKGLEGALLMGHGMVDSNVHFQDIVRLTQKLIELGKEDWELAVYPVESHGFVEPSSWTDEYKRILKLFEENLK